MHVRGGRLWSAAAGDATATEEDEQPAKGDVPWVWPCVLHQSEDRSVYGVREEGAAGSLRALSPDREGAFAITGKTRVVKFVRASERFSLDRQFGTCREGAHQTRGAGPQRAGH